MDKLLSLRGARAAGLGAVCLAFAAAAPASRVELAPPPAASAVVASPQQPAHAQADDSASLRQGTVAAVDLRRARIQVRGVWLDLVAGKTTLLRDGRAASLETLKPGEAIRFTVAPGASGASGAQSVRVIYVP